MKDKRKKEIYSVLLILIIIGITLGYAALSATFNINGSSQIKYNRWDIYFDNIQVEEDSVTPTGTEFDANISNLDKTQVSYNVTLEKPGDYYEFTVDVVNAGTVDGMVDTIVSKVNNESIDNLPDYLEFSITYNNGSEIKSKDLLHSLETQTYKVRLEYKEDINEEDLPSGNSVINIVITANYIQADNTGVQKFPFKSCVAPTNDIYTEGQYTYRFQYRLDGVDNGSGQYVTEWVPMSEVGWGVSLVNPESTAAVNTELCTVINGYPILATSRLFYESSAPSIDTSSFNTSKVIYMGSMFENAGTLDVDFDTFDTSQVKYMQYMFKHSKMTEIDLTSFDFSNVETTIGMFQENESSSVLFPKTFRAKKLRDMQGMFQYSHFSTIDLSTMETRDLENLLGTFFDTDATVILFSDKFKTDNVTTLEACFYASSVTDLDISSFNLERNPDVRQIFGSSQVRSVLVRSEYERTLLNSSTGRPLNTIITVK